MKVLLHFVAAAAPPYRLTQTLVSMFTSGEYGRCMRSSFDAVVLTAAAAVWTHKY